MIYLTTGGNGAGKTLLTLKDVRDKSLKENRPVYYNGRFDLVADFGWEKFDFKDWQTLPDGAILLVDECHNDMPVRKAGSEVPPHIKMLAEHRRRGFDFFLITQHPLNIDSFVRRLIASPGWHRHLKRASGAALVSVLTWNAVNDRCEKAGAGESADTKLTPYPKEVYKWYNSTSLDTSVVKIPFQVKVFIAAVISLPILAFAAYKAMMWAQPKPKESPAIDTKAPGQTPAILPAASPGAPQKMTVNDYVDTFVPRLAGFQHTASRYDSVTAPTQAPFPAACVQMGERCDCYTQQATKLAVDKATCETIVKTGFFMDWKQSEPARVPQARPIDKQPELLAQNRF